jgi:hypothetical protein
MSTDNYTYIHQSTNIHPEYLSIPIPIAMEEVFSIPIPIFLVILFNELHLVGKGFTAHESFPESDRGLHLRLLLLHTYIHVYTT